MANLEHYYRNSLFMFYKSTPKASLNVIFIRVSWVLNMLMWHCINEVRGGKSFMGAERVSSV